MTTLRHIGTVALSLSLAVFGFPASAAAATAAPAAQPTRLPVTVVHASLNDDMTIALDRYTAVPGYVQFLVQNSGAIEHELVVLRTDTPANRLPADPEVAAKALEKVHMGETGDMAAGHFSGLTLSLGAGHYAIICNELGHYMAGMHVDFEVTPAFVNVSLSDSMAISADQTVVYGGPIVFAVTNAGKVEHEMVILDTNVPAGQLPMDSEDPTRVSEVMNVGETGDIAPGSFSGLWITLEPGVYQVVCNEPGHFAAGMRFTLTVLPYPEGDEPEIGQ
ncbi:MAG TPA: sulfocyanin-like copper-binding protein [Candidatus Limnocylindria bacterium]|nr:sulfocyanin-like copper-binding protein [Candidatus Limnocylindria bacterium]